MSRQLKRLRECLDLAKSLVDTYELDIIHPDWQRSYWRVTDLGVVDNTRTYKLELRNNYHVNYNMRTKVWDFEGLIFKRSKDLYDYVEETAFQELEDWERICQDSYEPELDLEDDSFLEGQETEFEDLDGEPCPVYDLWSGKRVA